MALTAIIQKYIPGNAPLGATGSAGTGVPPGGITTYLLSSVNTPDNFYVDEDLAINIDLDAHNIGSPTQIPWQDLYDGGSFNSGPNYPYTDENDPNFTTDWPDWPGDINTHPEWWNAGSTIPYAENLVFDLNVGSGNPGREMMVSLYNSDTEFSPASSGLTIIADGGAIPVKDPLNQLGGVSFNGVTNDGYIIRLILFNSYVIVKSINGLGTNYIQYS